MAFGRGNKKTATGQEPKKNNNASLLIGVILAIVVFALIFIALITVQQKTTIMVATQTVSPYTRLSSSDFKSESVPKASVNNYDVTPSEFNKLDNEAVVTTTVLVGERLDSRVVTKNSEGTLSVVQADERVVGVSTTFPGAVAGSITPGLVVDVYGSSGGSGSGQATLATDAKVIGVGTNAGSSITPAGSSSSSQSSSSSSSSEGSIVVLLAVPSSAAADIAGQQVSLDIVPNLCFNAVGTVESIAKCTNPNGTANTSTNSSSGTSGTSGTSTSTSGSDTDTIPGTSSSSSSTSSSTSTSVTATP